ncbi:ELAV-like protein 1-B isoform X2 [Rhodnius prolixus]|uniref:ELAV-like protein 1-B isoform X2 n=1 Tax=Rhodnius prolixus TaxID=13249 RepID=UPI003D18E696
MTNEAETNGSTNKYGHQESSKTNLIINYLPPTMTQAEFVKMFQSVGEIDTFRLVKDKAGNSLGYGFVNYCNPEHAEYAVKTLNGTQISNKTIKVSFARPDPPKGINLYVSGLPATYGLQDLQKLFNPYGRIITTRLLFDDNKANGDGNNAVHALGFVRFEEKADAEKAIHDLNGIVPEGGSSTITVKLPSDNAKKLNASFAEFLTPKNQNIHKKLQSAGGKTTVPINKGLNRFSPMGGPSNTITTDIRNSLPVTSTMTEQNGHVIFVFGLNENSGDNALWQLFGPYGPVIAAKVVKDERNKCKGFGFVTMINYGDATEAIRALNGQIYGDKKLQVSFKQKKSVGY